jgi:glycine cleavage system transcriptional repressor
MESTSPQFMVSVMSRDRIGIVRDVSQALAAMQGDIADLRQSVLRGYFTMMLHVSCAPGTTAGDLQNALGRVSDRSPFPLQVCVAALEGDVEAAPEPDLAQAYVLTASGKDRIGFVAAVTKFCAEHRVNILDLSTAVADGLYTMILLVDVSGAASLEALRAALESFRETTGFRMVLQHHDLFRATNEIPMQ